MKTYEVNNYRYYWDFHLRSWVIYKIDEIGNQTSKESEYYPNKKALKKVYSFVK